MSNPREIIDKIGEMQAMDLLALIVENPFFLTDAYYTEIGNAIRIRHEELVEQLRAKFGR